MTLKTAFKADEDLPRAEGDLLKKKWSIADMDVAVRERAMAEADRRRISSAEMVQEALLLWLGEADDNPHPPSLPDGDALVRVERAIAAAAQLAAARQKPVPEKTGAALYRALLAQAIGSQSAQASQADLKRIEAERLLPR